MAINRLNVSLSGVQPGGLAKVVPSSVAVGSGSGSVDSNGTVTFSGASSVSLNDVFTSNYDSYKIILRVTSVSTALDVRLRYRISGSDNSTSNYYGTWIAVNTVSDATLYMRSGVQTAGYLTTQNSSASKTWSFDVHNPKLSIPTYLMGHMMDGGSLVAYNGGVGFNLGTSFDSITFLTSTGTMTGDVRVYGYTN